jgi:hypothetical protein
MTEESLFVSSRHMSASATHSQRCQRHKHRHFWHTGQYILQLWLPVYGQIGNEEHHLLRFWKLVGF